VAAAGGLRQREALVDEAGEIEAWAGALLRVLRGDGGRRGGGDGVDHRLGIGQHALRVGEQVAVDVRETGHALLGEGACWGHAQQCDDKEQAAGKRHGRASCRAVAMSASMRRVAMASARVRPWLRIAIGRPAAAAMRAKRKPDQTMSEDPATSSASDSCRACCASATRWRGTFSPKNTT